MIARIPEALARLPFRIPDPRVLRAMKTRTNGLYISGIRVHAHSFCVSFFFLNSIFVSAACVHLCVLQTYLFAIPLPKYVILFIHSPVDGHMYYLQSGNGRNGGLIKSTGCSGMCLLFTAKPFLKAFAPCSH